MKDILQSAVCYRIFPFFLAFISKPCQVVVSFKNHRPQEIPKQRVRLIEVGSERLKNTLQQEQALQLFHHSPFQIQGIIRHIRTQKVGINGVDDRRITTVRLRTCCIL